MHTGVRRSIVDKYFSVIVGYPTIRKKHIRHIPNALFSYRSHKVPRRRSYQPGGIIQRCHIHIQYIPEPGSTIAYSVCQMKPSLRSLDRLRPFTVLHLLDGMIISFVDDLLFSNLGMGYIVNQCPSDTTSATGIDKSVLRTGLKCILSIHILGVQHHITLLTLCFQIRQTFPIFQVFGTGNAGSGCS